MTNNPTLELTTCAWCRAGRLGPLDFIADDRTGERTYLCRECAGRKLAYLDGVARRRSEYAAKEYARCMRLPR